MKASTMALYFFRISTGRYSGASDQPYEFEDRVAAWTKMTEVCASMLGSIARSLKPSAQWHLDLLDENKQLVFRISLAGEIAKGRGCNG
jgi:uncharacterized protein DUF6894